MSLCGIMQSDFRFAHGRTDDVGNEGYTEVDLRWGIQYADDLLAAGFAAEPLYGYDLEAFRRWCLSKFEAA